MGNLLAALINWILPRRQPTSGTPINQKERPPLYKNQETNELEYPAGKDFIILNDNTVLEVDCAGRTVLKDGKSTSLQSITVTCYENDCYFDGERVLLTSFKCSQYPVPVARPTGNNRGNIMEFEIGFEFSDKQFLGFIQGRFDKNSINTLYTKINMDERIRWATTGTTRPDWKKGFFTDEDKDTKNKLSCINNLYTIEKQRETINKLLGLPADSTTCIQDSYSYYLAGGHLTAMADLIYASQQRATFFRLNAAPMWQIINNGNWKILEDNIRRFVKNNYKYISVYTGTHGVLALKRCGNLQFEDQKELYLGKDKTVPVPKFFWKVIYDEKSQEGTAFVVVNDPYLEKQDIEDYHICPIICSEIYSEISWLKWKPDNLHQGYAYCCAVEKFSEVVTTFPRLNVDGGLLTE